MTNGPRIRPGLGKSKPTVCVLQHAAAETAGLIGEVLKEQGIDIEYIRAFKGERVPQHLGEYAGLVVMGGPMGVYQQAEHPFLRDELRLIEDGLKNQKPVLGVCLGSQLLAAVLGAEVKKGPQREIGWHAVTLTEAAARDALFSGLPVSFTGFHWHGDVFGLPRGAVSLARSELTACQAFRCGNAVFGLLFHLEVSELIIRRMTTTFRRDLFDEGISEARILEGIPVYLDQLQQAGRKVFQRWARLVLG